MNMTKEERARRLRRMLAQIAAKKGIQEMQLEGVETPFAGAARRRIGRRCPARRRVGLAQTRTGPDRRGHFERVIHA
jgi:hypothetical protein